MAGAFLRLNFQKGGAYGRKQKILSSAVNETKEKLATLKTAAEQENIYILLTSHKTIVIIQTV